MTLMPSSATLYSSLKKWAPGIRDGALGIIGIYTLTLAIKLTLEDKLTAGGTLLTGGLFITLASGLSRFKSISGLGVTAKLHQLGEKIDEAERLFTHVREIVGLTADVTFQLLSRAENGKSALARRDALDIADGFRRQMKSLDVDDKTIEAHMLPWHKANLRDLLQPVHRLASEYLQKQNQETVRESFLFQHGDPADEVRSLAFQARSQRNTAFVVAINQLWEADEFAYVSAIESTILESSCGTEAERRILLSQIKDPLGTARYYSEKLDFKSREAWINAQVSAPFAPFA
jgi:hypothetical protein